MKLAMHILIYLTLMMILSSCGSGSSVNGNNTNSGYTLVQYQSGNNIYKYEYNDIGQRIKKIEPDGDIFTYKYNTNNQLISQKKTKKSGDVYNSLFTYNNIGQLVREQAGNGTIYTFTYDSNGNFIEIHNKTKNTKLRTYFYNALNQRIKILKYNGSTTVISYNTARQVIKAETTNSKGEVYYNTYEYTSDGRIKHSMDSDGNIRTYTYENKSCINIASFTTDKAFTSALCKK